MTSNGQVASPSKTVFMVLGDKSNDNTIVKVGEIEIKKSKVTKLLGIDVDADQRWKTHFNRLIRYLDRRLFHIRRTAGLRKITDSI
jgi:hypothetical protein